RDGWFSRNRRKARSSTEWAEPHSASRVRHSGKSPNAGFVSFYVSGFRQFAAFHLPRFHQSWARSSGTSPPGVDGGHRWPPLLHWSERPDCKRKEDPLKIG